MKQHLIPLALTLLLTAACGTTTSQSGTALSCASPLGCPAGFSCVALVCTRDADASGSDTATTSDTVTTTDTGGPTLDWTDPVSGLMWQGKHGSDSMTQAEAAAYCATLGLAGYSNWRLPTLSELRSLIRGCVSTVSGGACGAQDSCLSAPCWGNNGVSVCDGCAVNAGPTGGWYWPAEVAGSANTFWTGSLVADDTNYAWTVDFSRGAVEYYSVTNPYRARCVRVTP